MMLRASISYLIEPTLIIVINSWKKVAICQRRTFATKSAYRYSRKRTGSHVNKPP